MENENKKIKEPFEPQDTPKPPQIIEPNSGRKRENPVKEEDRSERQKESKKPGTKDKHLLSDEADIEDETTI